MSARVVPRRPLNVPTPPQETAAAQPRSTSRAPARAKTAPKPQAFAKQPVIVLDEAVHPARPGAAAAADVAGVERASVLTAEQVSTESRERVAAPVVAAPAPAAAPPAQNSADLLGAQRRAAPVDNAAAKAARSEEPAFAESDEEVVPPATASDPAVREAWLQRIRELVRDGHLDAARESLRAFRTRYPGQAVPEDLRALGE